MGLARREQPQGFPVEPTDWSVAQFCSYCGAQLNPLFYFCVSCTRPYKDVNTVVPAATPMLLTESDLIAKKAPHAWRLFWTYFVVLVATGISSELIFGDTRQDYQLVFMSLAVALTTAVTGAVYWRSLWPQLKQFGFHKSAAWLGLAVLAPLLGVNYLYHQVLVRRIGFEFAADGFSETGWSRGALVLMICAFPAVTEEIAFRGLLQHWFQGAIKPARAIILASALFAAVHFSVVSAPYLFAVGLLLGWAKWKTGSLYPSMLLHFLHNLVVIEFFKQ